MMAGAKIFPLFRELLELGSSILPPKFKWFGYEVVSFLLRDVRAHTDASPWDPRYPLVSVVIPCYNDGKYLPEAINSILAQTWQNFEIIVVDDGSTDPYTVSLFDTSAWPKTRVIHHDGNLGLPAARNTGIRDAKGRYVCCLDSDDKLHPTYLEKAISLLESNYGIDFVYPWTQVFGDESRVWYTPQFDPSILPYYNQLSPPAVFRRKAWEDVGGFREEMRSGYEDWEFWIRLTYRGYRGYRIPEKLLFYRRMSGGSFAQRAAAIHDQLVDKIHNYNPEIFINTEWIHEVAMSYKDKYVENPFINMQLSSYYLSFSGFILWINMHKESIFKSKLDLLMTHNKKFVIVSLTLLSEKTIDKLFSLTSYVYILPHFLPSYLWTSFVKQMIMTRNFDEILYL